MTDTRAWLRRDFLKSAAATGLASWLPAARAGTGKLALPGGRVVVRSDHAYEEWRRGMPWQMVKPGRFPAVIAQPTTTAEVAQSVQFARRNGLKVATKSGGHNVWANFLRDDGLLLDLSRLRDLSLDVEGRRAEAGPSIWAQSLIAQTLPHGLGFPVAHCATVPLGGFLLGGGFGLNGDQWGTMSCFAVQGAEVVTADGEVIDIDANRHAELFWALRGAGNGFPGVVTRFRLQLFEAPRKVISSTYLFPGERMTEVARLAGDLAADGPAHTEILGIAAIRGQDASGGNSVICALRLANFSPDPAEGRATLEAMARHPLTAEAMAKWELVETGWHEMFLESIDARRGFGFGRYAVDNLWTSKPAEVMALLAERLAASPSPLAHAIMQFKVRTDLPAEAALSRVAPAYCGLYSVWREEAGDSGSVGWLRNAMAQARELADGFYINEIDAEAHPESVQGSFTPAAWRRLDDLRQRVDRDGVFEGFFGA